MKTRKMTKAFLTLVLALVLCLGAAISTFAASGEWKQDSKGWWYKHTDGSYSKSKWEEINKKWYYFDETGYMVSGEYRDGYWVGSDGAWVEAYKGGKWASNKTGKWYTDSSGWYPVASWLKIDGKWYYFDKTGYLVTKQWVDDYYLGDDGAWVPDAKKIDYSGTYVDTFTGKATVTVEKYLENYDEYKIHIKWATSAYVCNDWYMTGKFDKNGTLTYKEGTKNQTDYDKAGGSTSKIVFKDLTGSITIKDGVLTWVDNKENIAKGNEFKKQEKAKITGKDYSGTYVESIAKRATFTIKATANDFYEVNVRWPGSAWEVYEYTFTGTFDKDGVLKYKDCLKTLATYDEDGNASRSNVLKNGTGSIKINEKGELKWTNDNEYLDEDTVFILDK
ncbi:Putative cell wall binding repeat-containing protein [Lachnospiraceae bacterium NE2001]|nr:Putative cell wall binding repeat-containing protein [Lachnospiraceae bacterium NE2001]